MATGTGANRVASSGATVRSAYSPTWCQLAVPELATCSAPVFGVPRVSRNTIASARSWV